MVCIDCGRPTAGFSRHCVNCGSGRTQNTDSLDGLWGRFKSKPKPTRRSRDDDDDYDEPKKSGGFFSGWWPFKLLFFPFWLVWKIFRLALRLVF